MASKLQCPSNYSPGCSCRCTADEPSQDCYYHGYPDTRRCPYCGLFRGHKPCKRCGCKYGLPKSEEVA